MTELLEVLLVLLALWGLCTALVRRSGLPASLAPLAVLSLVLLVLLAAGMADCLRPAAYVLLALGWALGAAEGVTALRRKNGRLLLAALAAPGGALFWGGAAALALWLCRLRPEFLSFDEYSFWGLAASLTTRTGRLYTVCETGLPWQMTQFAALPLAGFFFQPSGVFAAWRAIFAADVLLLAALAAAVAPAEKGGARLWGPPALAALLLPTIFSVTSHTAALNGAWLEFLGDLPAGVLFGGAVAFWLAVREQGRNLRWLALPVLCLAGNIKSNTFVLALAAAGIIAVDAVCFAPASEGRGPRALAGRLGFGAACLAAPAAQYLLWSRYTAGLVQANAASGGMGDTMNASLPAVVANGVRMLLGGTGEAFFEQHRADLFAYKAAMETAFLQQPVSALGAGAAVCGCIACLLLAALLLAPDRRERLRVAAAALCSAGCYLGYGLMLLLSYAFVLKDSTPDSLASYARYMDSCYAGWMLLALAMLARQAAASRRQVPARAAALAVGALAAALVLWQTEPQFTVLGASRGEYAAVRSERSLAARTCAALSPEDRVFLVCQGDTGYYWFLYAEALLPNILVYGAGGGTYGLPGQGEGIAYYQPCTPEQFAALVEEGDADYLLVARSDDIFYESYAGLFTDGLAAAAEGPALYRVTAAGYEPAALPSAEEAGL